MTDALLVLAVGVVSALTVLLVFLVREQRISRTGLKLLTVASGASLIVMVLSDWPFESLAEFWAGHSVLAGLLSTILLLALGFLAFEEAEQRRQEQLDSSLTAAGLSGVVDHLVDVEVALALLSGPGPQVYDGWEAWADPTGKPLRWLRAHRSRLFAHGTGPQAQDPRSKPAALPNDAVGDRWHSELVDQCVRRLSAALRDWSPVIGVSRNGRVMLVAIATVRRDLMRLPEHMEHGRLSEASDLLLDLRRRCRLMAYFFETQSGAYPPRPEVLHTFKPLPNADGATAALGGLSKDWVNLLTDAEHRLGASA